ncbi:hypothetical protein OG949_23440 [Streptomyces scopuliridis]|uniref:rRNA adenine N-6-methyltransferase family protein n=1 Tax=Streptomyces scopuliridis TaxID=452529 RepID=UPI002DDBD53A|nr:rRNA adenine N-6-methyltransferase family protein [Streptomyces scopuliridis]WSB35504.1 hypothetical protein OG949_23440 [Streptomyces scopuliridis]
MRPRPGPDGWLTAEYSDAPLVTQFVTESDGTRSPSSSASQPSTVLGLLEDAQLTDQDRVLEIGTGAGYNTALLCARLGANAVTSVEVDADLTARARANLEALSYAPTVTHTDGTHGWDAAAPYDRILATIFLSSGQGARKGLTCAPPWLVRPTDRATRSADDRSAPTTGTGYFQASTACIYFTLSVAAKLVVARRREQ